VAFQKTYQQIYENDVVAYYVLANDLGFLVANGDRDHLTSSFFAPVFRFPQHLIQLHNIDGERLRTLSDLDLRLLLGIQDRSLEHNMLQHRFRRFADTFFGTPHGPSNNNNTRENVVLSEKLPASSPGEGERVEEGDAPYAQ
jgi:hypothetical protein